VFKTWKGDMIMKYSGRQWERSSW